MKFSISQSSTSKCENFLLPTNLSFVHERLLHWSYPSYDKKLFASIQEMEKGLKEFSDLHKQNKQSILFIINRKSYMEFIKLNRNI